MANEASMSMDQILGSVVECKTSRPSAKYHQQRSDRSHSSRSSARTSRSSLLENRQGRQQCSSFSFCSHSVASMPLESILASFQGSSRQEQDDVGDIRVPSSIRDGQNTTSEQMRAVRSTMNKMSADHSEESRRLQLEIDDLKRQNADLEERLKIAIEDIDDKHAISEYAQIITERFPAAIDSNYVLRLQAQLCKALHKYGVLSEQVDLVKQQSNYAIKNMKKKLIEQGNVSFQSEQESMNDLLEMEQKLDEMKQTHETEMTLHREEMRRLSEELERERSTNQTQDEGDDNSVEATKSLDETVTTALISNVSPVSGRAPKPEDKSSARHEALIEELDAKDSLIELLQKKIEYQERVIARMNSADNAANKSTTHQEKVVTKHDGRASPLEDLPVHSTTYAHSA